jgi:hypothetical protein
MPACAASSVRRQSGHRQVCNEESMRLTGGRAAHQHAVCARAPHPNLVPQRAQVMGVLP